jgi:hypothetical protein
MHNSRITVQLLYYDMFRPLFFGHHQVVFIQSLSKPSAIPLPLTNVYNWEKVVLLFMM